MSTDSKSRHACLIIAPPGTDTSGLRVLLEERGWSVVEWENLFSPGRSLFESLEASLRTVSVVIAVLTGDPQDANVLVTIGVARGSGKRLLVLAPLGVSTIPE